eukprot:TRINITY_DN20514_c0_g1_i1.p2 TRINITY_DN20514_c0_g1~~TRINITY_DN20514_c0_g1_i1.p2  ORF type:complete len:102 (+),score=21.92 TRINITY_DN20514_c0_g1_i1:33-308(+)
MVAWCRSGLLLVCLKISDVSSRFGRSGFVEYKDGNVGIVVAVPHGGTTDASNIPNRRYGTFEGDDHTKELGEVVTKAICNALRKMSTSSGF